MSELFLLSKCINYMTGEGEDLWSKSFVQQCWSFIQRSEHLLLKSIKKGKLLGVTTDT